MPTVPMPDCSTDSRYAKRPGAEPLPGYVLLEPLGRGGFGEVWKCEAPGGLHKAVKFVAGGDEDCLGGDNEQLRQELEAFQQVKAIRHPFLLPLERVELVGNELVMVMGLADRQLGDRFQECRQSGLPGIPREELLGYLREAAEALDVISAKYGLQHLDVKPANLFLTAGHVQVGDYGLVSKLDGGSASGKNRGLTPKYAAPEVLRGEVHTRSDQYSLALVYHELLTGTFPYAGRNTQQLMIQHLSAEPDLTALPESDRGPVATALAKPPDNRFPSCRAFVAALADAAEGARASRAVGAVPAAFPALPPEPVHAPAPDRPAARPADDANPTHPTSAGATRLVAPRVGTEPPARPPATPRLVAPRVAVAEPPATPPPRPAVQLPDILSVAPVEWLRGREAPDPTLPPADMVRAILKAAGAPPDPSGADKVRRLPNGTWACRFMTTIDPRVAKVKLDLLWEQGGVQMDTREENRVIFRRKAPAPPLSGLFGSYGKKAPPPESGLEVVVQLPEPGTGVGEVCAEGRLFGSPPPDFALKAGKVIVSLLEGVRQHLNNFQERRKHPRIPVDFPVALYPLHPDGRVDDPLRGRCRDVSVGGLAVRVASAPGTKYAYVAFEGVAGTGGLGLLLQIIRANAEEDGVLVTGRYRLELWNAAPA